MVFGTKNEGKNIGVGDGGLRVKRLGWRCWGMVGGLDWESEGQTGQAEMLV